MLNAINTNAMYLSIPFMGYKVSNYLHLSYIFLFQFPLWDTSKKSLIYKTNNYFQFPLWDTEA